MELTGVGSNVSKFTEPCLRLLLEVDIENGVRHLSADGAAVGVMVLELVTQPPVSESALDSGLLVLLPPEGVPKIKKKD